MKKTLLSIAFLFAVISCTKEENIQACGYVYDKYYEDPQANPALRVYWLRMANDTLGQGSGNIYIRQVPKPIWDTMLVNSSWEYYCY